MTKKLIQKELANLNCFISNRGIIFVAKILSKKKTLGLDSFIGNSTKCLREEIIQILHKLSWRKAARREHLQIHFIRSQLPSYTKTEKLEEKKAAGQYIS